MVYAKQHAKSLQYKFCRFDNKKLIMKNKFSCLIFDMALILLIFSCNKEKGSISQSCYLNRILTHSEN